MKEEILFPTLVIIITVILLVVLGHLLIKKVKTKKPKIRLVKNLKVGEVAYLTLSAVDVNSKNEVYLATNLKAYDLCLGTHTLIVKRVGEEDNGFLIDFENSIVESKYHTWGKSKELFKNVSGDDLGIKRINQVYQS